MKKANFFVDEFITKVISKETHTLKKNEWDAIEQALFFVKITQIHWRAILLHALENARVAEKLAQDTCPTHLTDETLYIKVTSADETMLISLHARAIIECIKKTHAKNSSKNNHKTLCESLARLKPVYHTP